MTDPTLRDIAWGLVGFVNLYAWSRWAFRGWEGRPLSWRDSEPEPSPRRQLGRLIVAAVSWLAVSRLLWELHYPGVGW